MFDIASSLERALQRTQNELASAGNATARSQTPFGSSRTDTTMAAVAQRAVFTEALLGAMHARLAEIKSVTHG